MQLDGKRLTVPSARSPSQSVNIHRPIVTVQSYTVRVRVKRGTVNSAVREFGADKRPHR